MMVLYSRIHGREAPLKVCFFDLDTAQVKPSIQQVAKESLCLYFNELNLQVYI